ncbi:hypothetical protein BKK49_09305 [Rodentibacter rarus]|uniref:AAA family ATPase n=1 Tax=Rodentibacter rarus TaxID=1908260 RepID=UPI0009869CCB|nr:AAA family ATPase [Rodentibacter rarus]OOF38617.1 hypothetical protein BKK49_09305 [Rodentibacter rarus]
MKLNQQLIELIKAGYSTFYLHTAETARAENLVAEVAKSLDFHVHEINLAQGKINFSNKSQIKENHGRIEQTLNDLLDEDLEQNLFFIKNAKLALENNPVAVARLQYLIENIERHYTGECAVILQSSEVYIPSDIEPFITLLEIPLPKESDIKAIMDDLNIEAEKQSKFITALSGLNELEIKKVLTLIKQRFNGFNESDQDKMLNEIRQQKEQIIAKSGVLEMVKVDHQITDIGGLENLKKWLQEQAHIVGNLEKAKAFGVKAPKGALIAGMPGCGKSLTAKAAAALFQQPLVRLDIGSLLGKYVGESETNMRKALAMAESISPCVLWVDELEKAFVGMSGNNASEVSSRLLGYFLTWMQEKTQPVFIIATANDITALPPELLRKGRFDEIFYVGFPNYKERQQILAIHLNKAKQKVDALDLEEIARQCRDYSGADIENAVYDGVKQAFLANAAHLNQATLIEAISRTVPLRKTLKEKVGEYEKKFEELYLTPASHSDGLSIAEMNKLANSTNYLDRLKVANDAEVTEDILEKLVKDENLEVRKAAFSNANCTTKLLNAQVSLTENNEKFDREIREIIIKHNNISNDLILSLYEESNSDMLLLLESKNNLSSEIIDKLFNSSFWQVRRKMAQRADIPYKIQQSYAKDSDCDVRKALASNKIISEKIQLILVSDSDENTRIALARNNIISKQVQLILTEDKGNVCESLASNENLCEESQFILSKSYNSDIKKSLANNENLCERAQNILVQDNDWDVRKLLAQNENLCKEVQLILADDKQDHIRKTLAGNKSIIEEVQLKLTYSSSPEYDSWYWGIRESLASNINICKNIQLILAKDYYSFVREVLACNEDLSEEAQLILAKDSNSDVRKSLASNENLSEKILLILAKDGDNEVRKLLASNTNICKEVQIILAKDSDWNVRSSLVNNVNLCEDAQLILSKI